MTLGFVSLLGLGLFFWPFLGGAVPADAPALALGLGAVASLLILEVGTRRLDVRQVALLAALAAIDTALRASLVEGLGGFSPVWLLILCAGYALGPSFGFLCGALCLLVSAVGTGGVGPWVPYQIFAAGWVGVAAGFAGRLRRGSPPGLPDLLILAAVGVVVGFGYGALTDIQVWVGEFQGSPDVGWTTGMNPGVAVIHFARFYLLTSVAYDSFRAIGDALMVFALGLPVLAALGRIGSRFSFQVVRA